MKTLEKFQVTVFAPKVTSDCSVLRKHVVMRAFVSRTVARSTDSSWEHIGFGLALGAVQCCSGIDGAIW